MAFDTTKLDLKTVAVLLTAAVSWGIVVNKVDNLESKVASIDLKIERLLTKSVASNE